jgi:hypothetical protein
MNLKNLDIPTLGRPHGKSYPKVSKPQENGNKPIKGLRKVSLKRGKENREYLKLRQLFLTANPKCQVCREKKAVDVHHKRGRIGQLLTDIKHFLAVCRGCHTRIETNPLWAKEQGYSEQRN